MDTSSSPHQKKRLLCLSASTPLRHPWEETQRTPPHCVHIESWPLLQAHAWKNNEENRIDVLAVLVDLDTIAQTEPLDEWALKAWRATFNDLVLRCMSPKGHLPVLLAYTRQPSWERAILAVRIGARDLTKLSVIDEKILELAGTGTTQNFLEHDSLQKEEGSSKLLKWPDHRKDKESSLPSANLPKHAIPFPIEGLEGTSPAVEAIRNVIRRTAPMDTSVLICGATGSGKELVARALHRHSSRANGPFVAVNCGAISPGLIETELFGHIKGAYTGATHAREGLLSTANGGTLFLDEISELPLEFQVKLLRALQERVIFPVGSPQGVSVDIRVVSASKNSLDEAVKEGKFREDLLYRLRVIEIHLPALSERRVDIQEISTTLLKRLARRHKRPMLRISDETLEKFLLYSWPGNIRELENALEHGSTLAWSEERNTIKVQDLPQNIQFASFQNSQASVLKDIVHRFEREYIASTVRRLGGSKEHAAESLGLSLATLYRKLGNGNS